MWEAFYTLPRYRDKSTFGNSAGGVFAPSIDAGTSYRNHLGLEPNPKK